MKLNLAANTAMDYYMRVNDRNTVVIITDTRHKPIANALYHAALRKTRKVILFDVQSKENKNRKRFPKALIDIISSRPCVVGFNLSSARTGYSKNELMNKADPFGDLTDAGNKNIKSASIIDISPFLFGELVSYDPLGIKHVGENVLREVEGKKLIKIKTERGTNLKILLNNDWKNDFKPFAYGNYENLPTGEIYNIPINANGIFVADWIATTGIEHAYGPLYKNPLRFKIKDRKVVECDGQKCKKLVDYLNESICFGPNSTKAEKCTKCTRLASSTFAEVGLGIHPGIRDFSGCSSVDEKKLGGVHLGVGLLYPENGLNSDTHIDFILREPTVYVDSKMIIEKGRYVF